MVLSPSLYYFARIGELIVMTYSWGLFQTGCQEHLWIHMVQLMLPKGHRLEFEWQVVKSQFYLVFHNMRNEQYQSNALET